MPYRSLRASFGRFREAPLHLATNFRKVSCHSGKTGFDMARRERRSCLVREPLRLVHLQKTERAAFPNAN
jgi:hypothetical protein